MGADSFPCSQVSMRVTEFGKIGRIIRGNRPGVNGRLGNVLTFRRWGSFSEASPEFFGIVGFSNCECCIGGVPGCGEFPAMIFFLFDGGVVSDVGVGESEDIVAVGVFAEEHAKPEHLPDVLTGGIEHHFDSGFVPFKQHSEEAAGDVHDGGDIDADGESAIEFDEGGEGFAEHDEVGAVPDFEHIESDDCGFVQHPQVDLVLFLHPEMPLLNGECREKQEEPESRLVRVLPAAFKKGG